jgi:hypothetical protein
MYDGVMLSYAMNNNKFKLKLQMYQSFGMKTRLLVASSDGDAVFLLRI